MKSRFNTRRLCGKTGRFTRRARNKRSIARRFFLRSSPLVCFILSCFLQFLSFFFSRTKSCPKNVILRVFSPMMDIKLFYNRAINDKTHAFSKIYIRYPKYCYYTIDYNFFFPHFSFRIFPSTSASVILRYPVRVLQTPVSRGVDYNNNIYLLKNKNARRT